MKKMTLSKIALFGLCISGLISSAIASPRYTNSANVGIELTGGWFKGAVNDSGYGIAALNLVDIPPSGTFLKADTDTDFGGAVALTYGFAASPYTIALTYWKVDSDATDEAAGNIGITLTPATWGVDFATNASSHVNYSNDLVRLALGATFHPDCNATIMPQLGASYLRVKNDQGTFYSGAGVGPNTIIYIDEKSVFKGFGPSFSLDVDYKVGSGFSVFGDFIYSALIGDIVSSYSASQSNGALVPANIDTESKDMIVSLLHTEVGLAYLFDAKAYAGKLMIGYSAVAQLGASENNANFSDDVSDSKFSDNITNVGFQGPFARVTFNFDV